MFSTPHPIYLVHGCYPHILFASDLMETSVLCLVLLTLTPGCHPDRTFLPSPLPVLGSGTRGTSFLEVHLPEHGHVKCLTDTYVKVSR